jgi:hypothetical protein
MHSHFDPASAAVSSTTLRSACYASVPLRGCASANDKNVYGRRRFRVAAALSNLNHGQQYGMLTTMQVMERKLRSLDLHPVYLLAPARRFTHQSTRTSFSGQESA